MKEGLNKIWPHRKDYSVLHSFGATGFDTQGLPEKFSIYDGRPIPDQNGYDGRFIPALPPLPRGCVAETITFAAGIMNNTLYNPLEFYRSIPPGDNSGRDIRVGLQTAIDKGLHNKDGDYDKELAYFNCYGAGKIDDFDAGRIALWLNQSEKRGVVVGTYWYDEFQHPSSGSVPIPVFDTAHASLHCYLATGWDKDLLEIIPWEGDHWAVDGLGYMPRVLFNALMSQPYTGAFTIAAKGSPVAIGWQAVVDHCVYFVRELFGI